MHKRKPPRGFGASRKKVKKQKPAAAPHECKRPLCDGVFYEHPTGVCQLCGAAPADHKKPTDSASAVPAEERKMPERRPPPPRIDTMDLERDDFEGGAGSSMMVADDMTPVVAISTTQILGRRGHVHPSELDGSDRLTFTEQARVLHLCRVRSVSTLCSLNAHDIRALLAYCRNVEYNEHKNFLMLHLKLPLATAQLFPKDGKFIVYGTSSVKRNALATRMMARRVQWALERGGCGRRFTHVRNYTLANVTGIYDPAVRSSGNASTGISSANSSASSTTTGLVVDLTALNRDLDQERYWDTITAADYDPEESRTYLQATLQKPKAMAKIYPMGKIEIGGCRTEHDVKEAAELLWPLVEQHQRVARGLPLEATTAPAPKIVGTAMAALARGRPVV